MDSFHASEQNARLVVKAGLDWFFKTKNISLTSHPYAMHAGALLKSQKQKAACLMDSFHASEQNARLVVKAGLDWFFKTKNISLTSHPYAMHAGALLKSQK